MIRVLVCDDQAIVCEGLQVILESDPQLEVVGIAYDGAEALEKIPTAHPDIVLMDLKMPGMNGIHATRQIRTLYPGIPVLVLTTYDADAGKSSPVSVMTRRQPKRAASRTPCAMIAPCPLRLR